MQSKKLGISGQTGRDFVSTIPVNAFHPRIASYIWPIISCTSAMMAYPTPGPPHAILAAHEIFEN